MPALVVASFFTTPPLYCFGLQLVLYGPMQEESAKYLIESPINSTIESPAHYFPYAMDGGRGGFNGVCGLFGGWDRVCACGRACCGCFVGIHGCD
jgi:hypothetical protein